MQQRKRLLGWAWIGWFVASLAGLYQFLLQTSPSVMIPELESAFHLTSFGVSVLASSFFYTYLLCQIPAGILIDYFRPRRTLFFCLWCIAIICVLFATASHLWVAAACRIAMGFFCSPFIVSGLYLAAHSLPEKRFALFAGLTETLCMLGGVAGEAVLARGITHFGWRETLLILSGVAVVLAVLAWFLIPDEAHAAAFTPKKQHSLFHDLFSMVLLPQAWINGLFCGLLFGLVAAFGAFWCIPFLMHIYAIPLHRAADASSMMFVGVALGAPTLGFISSRFGMRRPVMITCTLCALVISLIIVYIHVSLTYMFGLLLLLGVFSAVYLLPFSVMRDITPAHARGTAMGFINMMCILIGAPILQPLIGWLLHTHAQLSLAAYQHAFMVIPVSLIGALILAFFVEEADNTR